MAEFRIQRRDSSNGMTDIRFVETSASSVTFSAVTADTFYGDGANLSGITDTFVTGFTFNPTTYQISIKQNEGQVDLTQDLSILASDVYVLSGVYNPSTGIVTYTNSTGGTFQVSGFTTGMTDSYTTSANLNGQTIEFNNNIQGANLYSVSLSPVLSGKTNLSLFNTHTGDTNNPHQTSFNNLTNTAHTHTLSEITDFNPYSGNVQSQLNSKIENGINVGGSNEIFSGKSGTDLYFRTISGGSNTTISTLGGVVRVDVTIPPDTNTFVTGSTVSGNTLNISRNDSIDILKLSGGTNIQFIDNGNNSITLNATSGGGASVSFPWKFKDPTISGDPGNGNFRFDSSVASAITEIYVSDFTNNNIDASNILNAIDTGDLLYIQQNDDATRAVLFSISASTIDNNGWFTIPVQYEQGTNIPKKDKICGWILASTGAEDNTASNVGVGQGVFKQKNVNDFEFYSLSGGSNTTLTLNNDTIVFDVTIPPDTNTFVTGFTYDNANTFTISRNDAVNLNATINTVTALTVTDYVDFTTNVKPTAISGRTYFDRSENALSYFPDTNNNDVTINIGQESVIRVYNGTGQQINNGQACHITSEAPSVNGIPQVRLAIATGSTATGSRYLVSGVATHDIPNGEVGFITSFGVVRDLTITGVTDGSEIYLSDTTPGGLIFAPPSNISSRRSQIGYVRTTGVTTAEILVEIENEVGFSIISNTELSIIAENSFSTGIRQGGEMTINSGDNKLIDISSGSGVIVDNYTDPLNPVVTNVEWDNITGVTITSLTAETGTYVFLEADGSVRQIPNNTPPSEADYRDYLFLGLVGHASKVLINNVFNNPIQLVSPVNQHQDLTSSIGPFSISGNRISSILGTLELEKSAGRSFFYGGNFHNNPKIPSQINTSILSGSTLIYAKGDSVLGPSGTTVDTDNYDPNGLGVITPLPGNNYTTHRIWHQPTNNLLIFQYGQYVYANQATARDEIDNEDYVVPNGLDFGAYLVAVIIIKGGDPDLDNAIIVPQGKFSGTGGGGGGSVDTLQTAYNNSTSPEIITDTTRNAVDFRIGTGTDSDNLVTFQQTSGTINAYVKGTGDAKFNSLSGDSLTILSTPTLNNSATDILVRNGNGSVEYREVSGLTWSGIEIITVGEDVNGGDLLYLSSGSTYLKASNTSEVTTSTELRIAVENILSGQTGNGLIQGKYTTTGLTAGDQYWVGASNGTYTNIQPSGNGDIVRYVGTALDSTILEFKPDETWIEISSASIPSTTPQPAIKNVTTNYNLLSTDYTINVTTTGDTTQTLPLSVSLTGKIYNIKNSDSTGTSAITIATTSGELIDNLYGGGNDLQIIFPQSIKLQSTGSGWIII
jgi:hypothetical protein